MPNALDSHSNDFFSILLRQLNAKLIHDYGIVDSILDNGYIIALSFQKNKGTVKRIACKYLTFNSAALGILSPPKKGDKVLLISMQHAQDSMYTATEPEEVTVPTGYGSRSVVAIPLGVFDDSSSVRLKIDTSAETVDVEVAFNTVLNLAKKFTATAQEEFEIVGSEVHLNGTANTLAKYAALNTQLQNLVTALNTQLNAIKAGAAAAVSAGGYWLTPLPSLGGLTLDLSSAETTTVKMGD